MYALILAVGCTEPLLPGEEVLGVDRAAEFTYGGPGDRLGAAVAGRDDTWLASAPGAGTTWRDGVEVDAASTWVGWWGEGEVLVEVDGRVEVDGERLEEVSGARDWAIGGAGVVAATADGLVFVDSGVVVATSGVTAIAWGAERLLGVRCGAGGCAAEAWTPAGEPLGVVAEAGVDGDVGEWEGVAWAGAPDWDAAEGRGRVCAEDGTCLDGEPGDHLGGSIGGGYTVGTFNKEIVPARARIVPLGDGPTLVLESGAELQAIHLAGDGVLVIGAPFTAAHGEPSGAVIRVPP